MVRLFGSGLQIFGCSFPFARHVCLESKISVLPPYDYRSEGVEAVKEDALDKARINNATKISKPPIPRDIQNF